MADPLPAWCSFNVYYRIRRQCAHSVLLSTWQHERPIRLILAERQLAW